MNVKIGVVMDPIESIIFKKDSTLAMLWAARDKQWQVFYIKPGDLRLSNGKAEATLFPIQTFNDPKHWFELGEPIETGLDYLDVILMRKDPPFDNEYIYNTYILEQAEKEGVLVVNKPQSLRDCNEKLFATHFPQCCPPLLVTANNKQLRQFHQEHRDVIFKPLDGMGGAQVFRITEHDPNLGVILETLTHHGKRSIMAQKYIPEISAGDKRILIVDGEAMPWALARVPSPGETRGNLAAGGTGIPVELTERDQWICEQLIPELQKRGLMFVGLDVIGDYLTEVNVTSPTCIRELDNAQQLDIGGRLMNAIEKRLAQ